MDPKDTSSDRPIVVNDEDRVLMEKNKRDLEKFFSLQNKRTQVTASISALALLLFVVTAFTLPLRDNLLNKLYPKAPSYANNPENKSVVPAPQAFLKLDTPPAISRAAAINVQVVLESSNTPVSVVTSNLKFDPKFLRVQSIDTTGTFLTEVTEKTYDNLSGRVSISGNSVGFKNTGKQGLVATITLKAKQSGKTLLEFTSASAVLSSDQAKNILVPASPTELNITP